MNKLNFILCAFLLPTFNLSAVNNETESILVVSQDSVMIGPIGPVIEDTADILFKVEESMPEFPGGMEGMLSYIAKNIRYPKTAKEVQGRVITEFVVDKDGSIVDVVVKHSVHPDLDAEAIRVIQSMPKWKPGMQRGKNVRVRYTIPISFTSKGILVNE